MLLAKLLFVHGGDIRIAVMHVTKIVLFDWYGVCLKVSGTRNRACSIASFLCKFLEGLSVL